MRYVRPREYSLNPRAPIDLLDKVVEHFQYSRRTFTEEEALAAVWPVVKTFALGKIQDSGRLPAVDISIWRITALPIGNWRIACGKVCGMGITLTQRSRNSTRQSLGLSTYSARQIRISDSRVLATSSSRGQNFVPS